MKREGFGVREKTESTAKERKGKTVVSSTVRLPTSRAAALGRAGAFEAAGRGKEAITFCN